MELLIGCGPSRDKRMGITGEADWKQLVTLDQNPDHAPDVVHDLESIPLPFAESAFDEIHAYEVLEHTGNQGDWRFFFAQFSDFWRVLKPGGVLFATVPSWKSIWAWGDPSHKRIISAGTLVFLSQEQYKKQQGVTSMTDFRRWYKADFEILSTQDNDTEHRFALKAIK